ncbi:MAG: AMP-binding protein [Pseudonocardiaceae bacterium]
MPLLPTPPHPSGAPALRFPEGALTHAELAAAAATVAEQVAGLRRVAVWGTPTLHTAVAVAGALTAGVPVVPLNPKAGERELAHVVSDSEPGAVLAAADADLPGALFALPRLDVDPGARAAAGRHEPGPETSALVVYTSGTTGPPKGVVLPRRALAAGIDVLAAAWEWTGADVVVHALPLFHVHGLVQGLLGPLRLGGTLHHLGRFDPAAIAAELAGEATVLFGVPTMYSRLADAADADPELGRALGRARLLVSGSAALPASLHERIRRITGQRVLERYGMTETLLTCSNPAAGERRPGTVGLPLTEVRLVGDDGAALTGPGAVGELEVRGPTLFTGYLNRPDATAEVMRDGWFRTGDVATMAADGYVTLVGRKSTDLISSGGYRIGAGEIENALLEHPGVAEVAVAGRPDDDLGERVVAWVVPATGARPDVEELGEHVAGLLAPHKRPRAVHLVRELPRNDMGKVLKRALPD